MWRRALIVVLVAQSAACARAAAPPESALRRVRVETDAADVTGVLTFDGRVVCRLPCTVRLREETAAVVRLDPPANEQVTLPDIPAGGTVGDPVRIVVHPTRGHPALGTALLATGAAWSAFVGLAVGATQSLGSLATHDSATRSTDWSGAIGLLGLGAVIAGVGILFLATSSSAHADAITPKRSGPSAGFTPQGFEVRF